MYSSGGRCFDQLGGLDEGAFLYFEDADFCLRAQAAGWGLAVAAGTAILHREGASASPSSPRTVRLVTAAGLHFLGRHAPVAWLAGTMYVLSRVAKRLLRADLRGVGAVLAGVLARRRGGRNGQDRTGQDGMSQAG